MTISQKRIKIAIACGWTQRCSENKEDTWVKKNGKGIIDWSRNPPDYFFDLNAMHEAENLLDDNEDLRGRYRFYLLEMLKVKTGADGWRIYRATATQRAEAFGRACNLW